MKLCPLLAKNRQLNKSKSKNTESAACPCGKGLFTSCCQPLLTGERTASNAEALMRSRYTAYAQGLSSYVLTTWHPSTRPEQLNLLDEQNAGVWIGLSVKHHKSEGASAEVEFVARYKPSGGGAAQRLHERSRFVLENGQWFYVDGDLHS